MSGMDLGIDFFVTTTPWCLKLKEYAEEIMPESDEDGDL